MIVQDSRRNPSVDILKFVAVLLIVNSHFDEQYPAEYNWLATGGAIGDVLFFFCSGYTLFLGRMGRFDAWYKRRIRRIYPSVLALGLMTWLVWSYDMAFGRLILVGAGWFVSCIMIYYVLLYLIRRFLANGLTWVYVAASAIILTWYAMFFEPFYSRLHAADSPVRDLLFAVPLHVGVWIYKWNYLKWGIYFIAILMGAHVGKLEAGASANEKKKRISWPMCLVWLVGYVALFYGIMFLCVKFPQWDWLQIVSVAPLMGVCLYTYRLATTDVALRLAKNRLGAWLFTVVGGLCLEEYLVQPFVRTTALNHLFPLNLVILFILIVIAAYVCRAIGRIIQQTFSSEDGYDWRRVFSLV